MTSDTDADTSADTRSPIHTSENRGSGNQAAGIYIPLSLATIIATYGLIAVGSLVRAAGAGLGCPDWPKCFGSWIPPTSADSLPPGYDAAQFNVFQTWLEYGNRLVGVTIGFLIFATLVSAWRHYRRSAEIFWPSAAAFVLVGVEGWLGGRVVEKELADDVLTAHMLLALVIVGLLLYAHLCARFGAAQRVSPEQRRLGKWAGVIGGLLLLQAGIGTRVRYAIDELGKTDIPRSEWLPLDWWPDLAHRQYAVVIAVVCGLLWWRVRKLAPAHPGMRAWAQWSVVIVFAQLAIGLGLAYGGVPQLLQISHLVLGSLLIGAVTVFVFHAYRVVPDSE